MCLGYLGHHGITHWRQNTGGTFDAATGRLLQAHKVGVADILGVLPGGRFLAVEVKTASGVLSEGQKTFLQEIRDAGGLALVVRSLADLKRGLGHA